MSISVPFDPYKDVAESAVTSNVIDARDAFDFSFSWRTTSGTTSINTIQMSNHTAMGSRSDDIPEASWSNWTTFGDSVLSRTINPPLGIRYYRLLRENRSGVSFIVEANKIVSTR